MPARLWPPLALAAMAAAQPALAQQRALASPAIDRDLFREGEVVRIDRAFFGWRMVCDDIRRLKQRFCSMHSRAFDGRGNAIADVIVSTADDGRPAALVTLAYGLVLTEPVVAALAAPGKRPQVVARLAPLFCSDIGCKIVWPLTGATIKALRDGADVALSFRSTPTPRSFPGPTLFRRVDVSGRLAGAGFNEALLASLK